MTRLTPLFLLLAFGCTGMVPDDPGIVAAVATAHVASRLHNDSLMEPSFVKVDCSRLETRALKSLLSAFAICAFLVACKPDAPPSQLQQKPSGPPVTSGSRQDYAAQQRAEGLQTTVDRARAELQPTQGHKVRGRIELERQQQRVHITGEVTGLSPGEHGFHIHETGDCSDPAAKSAGDHFAPHGRPHGAPDSDPNSRHAGDFGNITANSDGVAKVDVWGELALLTAGQSFVVGKAFIVHADKDDLKSQPSGNAGARVACGVIRAQDQVAQP